MIVLARHGVTEYNAQGRFLSRTDLPLNEEGRRQASELASALREYRFGRCYSSPMRRCIETCDIVMPEMTAHVDAALREVDFGAWEGRTLEWIERNDPQGLARRRQDPVHFRPPDGESFADVAMRLRPLCDRLTNSGDAVLVVAHRGTLSVLERLLRGVPLESRLVASLEPAQFHAIAH